MSAIGGAALPQCVQDVEDVAELYAAHATRVRRLVRLGVTAPDAVIEDACQVAWMRLVDHRARIHRETATRWLVRVAVHEALKLLDRGARDVSLDELADESGESPLRSPDLIEELADRRSRLAAIGDLPTRQQRLVWLQICGFSYAEMVGETGDTYRTVERQLLRAKRSLSAERAAA
jgi:RNA polymerase sigma factor (sigma-70 family)